MAVATAAEWVDMLGGCTAAAPCVTAVGRSAVEESTGSEAVGTVAAWLRVVADGVADTGAGTSMAAPRLGLDCLVERSSVRSTPFTTQTTDMERGMSMIDRTLTVPIVQIVSVLSIR